MQLRQYCSHRLTVYAARSLQFVDISVRFVLILPILLRFSFWSSSVTTILHLDYKHQGSSTLNLCRLAMRSGERSCEYHLALRHLVWHVVSTDSYENLYALSATGMAVERRQQSGAVDLGRVIARDNCRFTDLSPHCKTMVPADMPLTCHSHIQDESGYQRRLKLTTSTST